MGVVHRQIRGLHHLAHRHDDLARALEGVARMRGEHVVQHHDVALLRMTSAALTNSINCNVLPREETRRGPHWNGEFACEAWRQTWCSHIGALPHVTALHGSAAERMPEYAAMKSPSHAVLFATASFWQGVDVRGEQLSCVIIDKLPFAVPSDPIIAARQRHIEEAGGSSFYEYSVPQAIISLKQGLGRLIRSTTDRGVLAVLDPRLTV